MAISKIKEAEGPEKPTGVAPAPRDLKLASPSRRLAGFAIFALVVIFGFLKPLGALIQFSLQSELHSHLLLIPAISLYLVWLKRNELPRTSTSVSWAAAVPFVGASLILLGYWIARKQGWNPNQTDYLSVMTLSFVCFLTGGVPLFFGWSIVRALAFPVAFLFLLAPFPVFLTNGIEVFFQHASAEASAGLFSVSGMPVFRQGLFFHLPGIVLEVAQECSGVRSSLVLFISSLLAGHLFLRSPWKRAALALAVIPLAIVRNGLRIFTIASLCVHVDPAMIDSPLHHRGGPVFFALSLIPFFALLWLLRKSERTTVKMETVNRGS